MPTLDCRAVLLSLALVATPCFAQQRSVAARRWSVPIDAGSIIRVRTHDSVVTQGTLMQQTPSLLMVGHPDRTGFVQADSIQASDIASVDRQVRRRHALQGLGIGAGAGALAGVGLAAAGCAAASGNQSENYCGLGLVLIPPMLAAVGGVVGLVAGTLRVTTHWEPATGGR